MRAFITGVSGFIGSHLAKHLTDRGEFVVGLMRDSVPLAWTRHALEKTNIVYGDLSDLNLLRRVLVDYNIDTVFHLGSVAIVKKAQKDPVDTFSTNVMGTVNLLEACRQVGLRKRILVHITDKIYGNTLDADVFSPYKPLEVYSASKVCQDVVAQSYETAYDMEVLRTRSCNVFGLDYNDRIIPNTIRAALSGKRPVIYEGENTMRQYIYIDDLLSAFHALMETGRYGPWNIATDIILSQSQVVEEILRHPRFAGIEPERVKRVAPQEISRQSIRCSEFLWRPKFSFREGIDATVEGFEKWGI